MLSYQEEKRLLLDGIALLKSQLISADPSQYVDLCERIDTLRNCLECLVRSEIDTVKPTILVAL